MHIETLYSMVLGKRYFKLYFNYVIFLTIVKYLAILTDTSTYQITIIIIYSKRVRLIRIYCMILFK
jgi:hypothetical protein